MAMIRRRWGGSLGDAIGGSGDTSGDAAGETSGDAVEGEGSQGDASDNTGNSVIAGDEVVAGEGSEDEPAASETNAALAQDQLPLSADAASASAPVLSGSVETKFVTRWLDNTSTDRPSLGNVKNEYRLQLSVDGGAYGAVLDVDSGAPTDLAKTHLGLTDESDTAPYVPKVTALGAEYHATVSNLPNQSTLADGTVASLAWRIVHEGHNGYLGNVAGRYRMLDNIDFPYVTDDQLTANENLVLLREVTFTIVGKIGNMDLPADASFEGFSLVAFHGDEASAAEGSTRWTYEGITEGQSGQTMAGLKGDGRLTVSSDLGQNTWKLTATMPSFALDDTSLRYKLHYAPQQAVDADGHLDYFAVYCDNTAAPNHGSDVDAAYSGGTMTIVHKGTTSFDAYKVWYDEEPENRPATNYTLWRYSLSDDSPAHAAPVRDVSGQQLSLSYTAAQNADLSIGEPFDLGAALREQYPTATLDKYDPDGYPYIYLLREEAPGNGYERVFGVVAQDGSAVDTAPSYWDAGHAERVYYKGADDAWGRASGDISIYDGGTVTNRRSEVVSVRQAKTWKISSFQNQLQDVTVTFTLQRRFVNVDTGEENPWSNVTDAAGEVVTKKLDDWRAENLTQSFGGTYPKFSEHGRELEYRWVETSVQKGDAEPIAVTYDKDGVGHFSLTVQDAFGKDEQLDFTSTTDEDTGLITNEFMANVELTIYKKWIDNDVEVTDPERLPEASVRVIRDDELLYNATTGSAAFVLDGVAETEQTPISASSGAGVTPIEGAYAQETEPWKLTIVVPKYNEDGSKYTYLVLEHNVAGWHTTYETNAETNTTTIVNTRGDGAGSTINITKHWNDGGNTATRMQSVVNVYTKQALTVPEGASVTVPDVLKKDELTTYGAGAVIAAGTRVGQVVLDPTNGWFKQFSIPISGLTKDSFDLEEAALVDMHAGNAVYELKKKSEYPNDGDRTQEPWEALWTSDNDRIPTGKNGHVFEVTYGVNDLKDSLEVTNTRVGKVDLSVKKTWKDKGADANQRPKADLTLTVNSAAGATFELGEGGGVQLTLDEKAYPIALNEGAEIVFVQDRSLSIKVDPTKDESSYQFGDLPKYDARGRSVSYAVTEQLPEDSGDYTRSVSTNPYNVGPWHCADTQQIDITNKRSGTKDVKFHTHWWDEYVYHDLGQRPDIYLKLYCVENGKSVEVTGFEEYSWAPSEAEGANAEYQHTATIKNLPKYDDDGAEIFYFAQAATSLSDEAAAALDYRESHDFSYEYVTGEPGVAVEWVHYINVVRGAELDNERAICENGTFNFRIQSDITLEGIKLWKNVPAAFAEQDLPAITVTLRSNLEALNSNSENVNDYKEVGSISSAADADTTCGSFGHVRARQYKYTFENDINGNALPKYDDRGRLVSYKVSESIDGIDDPELADKVFVKQGGDSSFQLENAYASEKGSIQVTKTFDGNARVDGDPYPSVTFDLYRQYTDATGEGSSDGYSAKEFVTTKVISADKFKGGSSILDQAWNAVQQLFTGDARTAGTANATFEDLEIYAPNGSKYQYFVVERSIGGHATTVTPAGDRLVNAGDLNGTPSGYVEAIANGATSPVTVSFTNTYVPDTTQISGTKVWVDYDNYFGTRPEEGLTLTVTRKSGTGFTEDVTLNSQGTNVLVWDMVSDTGNWTYTISDLERWAPDGTAWTYSITEVTDERLTGYTPKNKTVSVTADAKRVAAPDFENTLSGSHTVEKEWEDGEDVHGLRPKAVTVELQAREKGAAGEWKCAREILSDQNGGLGISYQQTLNAENGWKTTWNKLPMIDRNGAPIEYRAVEVKIGDDDVTTHSIGENSEYGQAASYRSSGKTDGATTTITNTLDATSLKVVKQWDDGDNLYESRPTGSNDWQVTYHLRRESESTDPVWVTKSGQDQPALGNTANWDYSVDENGAPSGNDYDRLASATSVAGSGNKASATFAYLPRRDNNGKPYTYTAYELVPGSYSVTNASDQGYTVGNGKYKLVPVATSEDGSPQVFENKLNTTSLSGTKTWNDWGVSYTHSTDEVTFKLYRKTAAASECELVTTTGETASPQPTWTTTSGATWSWTYEGLPKADKQGNAYTYWVEEVTVPGYVTTYDGGDKTATVVSGDTQSNVAITNTATRFALEKICDRTDGSGNAVTLNDVELSVLSTNGQTLYAQWTRDAQGNVATKVWPSGTSLEGTAQAVDGAGYIVGLPADSYLVRETKLAADHAPAHDVSITVGDNGSVAVTNVTAADVTYPVLPSDTRSVEGVDVVVVRLLDPLFAGHLTLTKTIEGSDEPVEGAVFNLYRMTGDAPDVDADELIASGITTDARGVWTSAGSDVVFSDTARERTGYGRETLSEGLLPGTYYFEEVSAPDSVVVPQDETCLSTPVELVQGSAASGTASAPSSDHATTKQVTMTNEQFAATVSFKKIDALTGDPVEGAVFVLEREGADGTWEQVGAEVTTGADGVVEFSLDRKGTYRLTETACPGYDMPADSDELRTLEFVVADADQGTVIDPTADDAGWLNTPLLGAVELTKTDDAGTPLDGAEFKLERKTEDDTWETVAEGLLSGKTYRFDAASNTFELNADATVVAGVLRIDRIPWGEYRLVETKAPEGYVMDSEIEPLEFAFDRGYFVDLDITTQADADAATVYLGPVVNYLGMTPLVPAMPVPPTTPTNPSDPSTSATKVQGGVPQTGDDSLLPIGGLLALGVVLVGAGAIWLLRRRK